MVRISVDRPSAVCVKPHPRLNPRLRMSRALNGEYADRVHFVFAGVGSKSGSFFLRTPLHFGASEVVPGPCKPDEAARGRCNRIDVVTIDEVAEATGSPLAASAAPIFIKVDVEGLEYEAFQGMERLLRSGRVHAIYFECNDKKYKTRGYSSSSSCTTSASASSGPTTRSSAAASSRPRAEPSRPAGSPRSLPQPPASSPTSSSSTSRRSAKGRP